jgi:hypothetical protein
MLEVRAFGLREGEVWSRLNCHLRNGQKQRRERPAREETALLHTPGDSLVEASFDSGARMRCSSIHFRRIGRVQKGRI